MVTKTAKKKPSDRTAKKRSATSTTSTKKKKPAATNARKTVAKKKPTVAAKKPVKKTVAKKVDTKPAVKAKAAKASKAQEKPTTKVIPKSINKKTTTEKMVKKENKPLATAIHTPAKTPSFMATRFEPYSETNTESYMNDKMLMHFRKILEVWRQELMEQVDNTIHGMKEAVVLADLNDRATQEEEFNFELRTRDRERKLLKKIEEAIKQIDDKEYGYCAACGVEIGVKRLEARPTAQMCIDCKTLDEIREKRIAS